jgi:glucuronoarabinoxylan endo-1,4-beta-xylanase
MKKWLGLVFLFVGSLCHAQSATIDWTNVHQVIVGFGASDHTEPLPTAQQQFFFGTTGSDIGLSLLRIGTSNGTSTGAGDPGDCTTVSTSCAGQYGRDMQAVIAAGGKVTSTTWSVPAQYSTSGNVACAVSGQPSGQLISSDYSAYAQWVVNFIKSVQMYDSVNVYALSVEAEPDGCWSTENTYYTPSQLDNFIANYLGPTFQSNGISTLIEMPETSKYRQLSNWTSTCGADPTCSNYVGAILWHDYDISFTAPDTVSAAPYPSNFPAGKLYMETETSCYLNVGPTFCASNAPFDPSMTDALHWAAVIDQRFAVDNVNAWSYFWFWNGGDNEGLMSKPDGTPAQRAYVLGQYSRFVRPGYYRIDATHVPETGISVSAYQDVPSGHLVIVATNYTSSAVTQTFSLANAPTFTSVTPYTTSANEDIQAQTAQSLSGNVFSYTLPADSVTTFVGLASSTSAGPAAPTNLRASVN